MKNLLIGLSLFLTIPAFASNITKKDLLGISVARLNIEGPFFVVQLIINADGTYNYRDASISAPMPKPGCTGTYTFENNLFEGTLDCSAIDGPKGIKQTVDFSNVSKEELNNEEGALINVQSSLMGSSKMPFKIVKLKDLYFQD